MDKLQMFANEVTALEKKYGVYLDFDHEDKVIEVVDRENGESIYFDGTGIFEEAN
ncbi:FlaG/YvyC family protein [Bacillus phage Bolokhovo]|uniref:FlaG/YvyC family protein n=1 Tax=Bacillus phage Bolokhovo TaxID=2743970 RepID=A0A7D7KHU2_9CAUD|nr:FlaG/YvyC family protein [Bacillus phage Bolokhovo]